MVATRTDAPHAVDARERAALLGWSWGLLGGLLLENILGIGLTLYVTVPSSVTFTQLFVTTPLLTAHIVLGFALVVTAALLLLRVRRLSIPGLAGPAALVLVFVILALQEGFTFAFTGDNAFSYGMEVGFVLAVGFQASLLFRVAQVTSSASTTGAARNGPAASP